MQLKDLKTLFPLSYRHIVRENFWWVILFLILCLTQLNIRAAESYGLNIAWLPISNLSILTSSLLVGAALVLALKMAYSLVLHSLRSYKVQGEELFLSKGFLRKESRILFLARITDVYLKRNLLDAMFGLNAVGLAVIGEPNIIISGFSNKSALGLQRYLIALIEQVQPKAQAPSN